MPAPDIATLLNIPPVVEAAFQARLNGRLGTIIKTFIQRQPGDLPAQRIQVQCTLGPALNHLRPMGDGTFQRDAWPYTLTLGIFTQREKDNTDLHGVLRGRIGDLVTALRYDATFLPWYVLSTMQPQAVTESVQVGEDSDASQLVWTGSLCIRPDAWPA
jgi:hypothetical protein